MNWFTRMFGGGGPPALSPEDMDGYMGFSFLRRSMRPDGEARFRSAIDEIRRKHPGRIVDSEQITVRIASDGAFCRVCYFIKKGESPTDFSKVMTGIFERHWG